MKSLLFTILGLLLYCCCTVSCLAQDKPAAPATPTAPAAQSPPAAPAPRAAATISTDTAKARAINDAAVNPPDDDFSPVVLVIFLAIASLVVGGILAGCVAVMGLLLVLFALVSAGIASAGVLVGLYRKSAAAGFKTILYMGCSLAGMLTGALGFWLINHFFHISLSTRSAVVIGAGSGLLGGLLLGIVLFILIRLFMEYCRQKLSF